MSRADAAINLQYVSCQDHYLTNLRWKNCQNKNKKQFHRKTKKSYLDEPTEVSTDDPARVRGKTSNKLPVAFKDGEAET